jgi:DNA-binding protein H-NS
VRSDITTGKIMATLEKVQAQISKLQARAEALVAKQSGAVLAKIRELMEKHNLTIADIDAHSGGSKKRGPKPGAKVASAKQAPTARYQDPKSGATWSGYGRAPSWIAGAKDRNKFLISGSSAAPATTGKSKAKAGSYVRGPQPALYADPKTGATWSGRGRAPAWLADVKDRSKFLIAGAAESKPEPKAAVAKKTASPVKKVATKKVATKKAVARKSIGQKIAAAAKKAPAKKAATRKPAAKKVVDKEVNNSTPTVATTSEVASQTGSVTSA